MASELARCGVPSVENISGTGPSGAGARLGVQDEDLIGPVLAARSQCIRCFRVRTVRPGTATAYPSPARAHSTSLWRICISSKANLNLLSRTLKRASTTPSQRDHISRRGKPPRTDDRNNMQDTERGHRRAPAASAPVEGPSAAGACSQGCGRKKKKRQRRQNAPALGGEPGSGHVLLEADLGAAVPWEHVRAEHALVVEAGLEEHRVEPDVVRVLHVHAEQSRLAVILDLHPSATNCSRNTHVDTHKQDHQLACSACI